MSKATQEQKELHNKQPRLFVVYVKKFAGVCKSIWPIRMLVYWSIFIAACVTFWIGLELSIVEYIENRIPDTESMAKQTEAADAPTFLAPAYIAIGAGVLTVYLTGFLQKLTKPVPREEWVKKLGACNDNLVASLLKYHKMDTPSETKRFHSKKAKITAEWQVTTTLDNIRRLERMLRRQGLPLILKLNARQLKQIRQFVYNISDGFDAVYQRYGYTFTGREFTKDLIDLESCLKQTIQACNMLEGGDMGNIELIVSEESPHSEKPRRANRVSQRQNSIILQVPASLPKRLRNNPGTLWIAISLTDYLTALIDFMNSYGYGSNSVSSIAKSRLFYYINRG